MRGLEARVQMALHVIYFGLGMTTQAGKALLAAQSYAYEDGRKAGQGEGNMLPPLIADDSQLTQAYLDGLRHHFLTGRAFHDIAAYAGNAAANVSHCSLE